LPKPKNFITRTLNQKYTKANELLAIQKNAELKKRFRAIGVVMPNMWIRRSGQKSSSVYFRILSLGKAYGFGWQCQSVSAESGKCDPR
jgi:hypothetical protein